MSIFQIPEHCILREDDVSKVVFTGHSFKTVVKDEKKFKEQLMAKQKEILDDLERQRKRGC